MEQDYKRVLMKTGLDETEVLELLSISEVRYYKKGEYFLSAGETPRYIAVVSRGLFRYVYLDADGNEFTKNFLPENNFIVSYSAMVQQQSSAFGIEALEDSEVLRFSFAAWKKLTEGRLIWETFLRRMVEKAFFIKERRERELLLLDAASRYRVFIDEYPSLEYRVKQSMIASYLGIKPESLSRIRRDAALT